MAPELESVARGVLLRLVRLPEEGTAFTPVVLPREALLAGGEREKVQRVLEALQQAGALTVVRASRGAPESVRLSYEALLRLWPRLAGWLEKRVLFRDAALFWDKHNRDRGALFTGVLLEEAKPYQDLNALEREFVRACQAEAERLAAEQRRSTRRWQATAAVIAALLLLSLGCGYWAFASERAKQKATEAEKQASEKLLQTQRVANTAALLRTFGNLASAQSRVEEKLVQQRWNIIARRARDDPFLTAYIEQFGPTSPAWERVIEIKHSRRTFDQSVDQSSGRAAFLPVVRDLRKKLIESDDPEAVAQLTTLRTDYFDNVRFLSHEIVEAAEAGDSYASVVPLIQEFWRLYWWEMCLVEGKNVESTMVDFGKFLNEWKQRGERRPDAGWLKRLREQRELLVEALAKEQNQPLRPTP
jgi:hypothetical protein